MYELETYNKKVNKKLEEFISSRPGIKDKLKKLKLNPHKEIGAHLLHGKLVGLVQI